ncbi:MAG: prephenate dehydrogenase/arogenate dehydrogenase family protein [Lentisphaerae bacterium]|nr:prephenate dehydrogenase/arogenate dehydrogenase family protein [Lentisphaerota bacterium]
MKPADRIAVLGLGLMGGSLGLALKARGHRGAVAAFARREATRRLALDMGAADEVHDDPAEAVRGAAIVVACAPVLSIPDLIARAAPGLEPGAVVTDVGSTKGWIAGRARAALAGGPAVFVGSHPIAGSERQGMESAYAGLYEGAVTVVTPDGAPAQAVAAVEGLWTAVGSQVLRMDAGDHDRIIARTSHLPHMAAALVSLCAGRGGFDGESVSALCGPGIRDTTRVAEGSPEIWHDIALTNRDAIAGELEAMVDALAEMVRRLRAGDFDGVRRLLAEAREARRRVVPARGVSTEEPA